MPTKKSHIYQGNIGERGKKVLLAQNIRANIYISTYTSDLPTGNKSNYPDKSNVLKPVQS